MRLFRHLAAVAILPFTVTVLVPWWIASGDRLSPAPAASAAALVVQGSGVVMLAVGLALFGSSLRRFADEGEGTLAPWDPPRRLVVQGPYRFVRNPMISGVVFILAAEAMLFLSSSIAIWAVVFLALNCVVIPLVEEPMLAARFGEPYREYCRHVPRVFPRLRPWRSS